MQISKTHLNFSKRVENLDSVTTPQVYLGPNYETVLNFWWFLDSLTVYQKDEAHKRFNSLGKEQIRIGYSIVYDAAKLALPHYAKFYNRQAWLSAYNTCGRKAVFGWATEELIGANHILEQEKKLTFVQLFDNL